MQLARHHGGGSPGLLDFSAPRNPRAPLDLVRRLVREALERGVAEHYPDPLYTSLREVLAEYLGVEPWSIIPLNGAAEAYSLLPLVVRAKHLAVIAPSFGDHLLHAFASGKPLYMLHYRLVPGRRPRLAVDEELVEAWRTILRGSLVYISNPNNPSGSCTPLDILELLAEAIGEDGVLVVDEAFQPLSWSCPSILGRTPSNTVVLLSFTKLLGVPGLRIGVLVDEHGRVSRLVEAARQPWNVNSIAAYVLEHILAEHRRVLEESIVTGREVARREYERIAGRLEALGCRVFETTAPYMIVEHGVRNPLAREALASRGVWVRSMEGYEPFTVYHSRVSILDPESNDRLLAAFEETGICEKNGRG